MTESSDLTPNIATLLKSRVLKDFLPQNWSNDLFEEFCSDSGEKKIPSVALLFILSREIASGRVDSARPYETTEEELGEAIDYFSIEVSLEELRRKKKVDFDSPTVDNFLTNRSGQVLMADL